jgi:hypothetical protein
MISDAILALIFMLLWREAARRHGVIDLLILCPF